MKKNIPSENIWNEAKSKRRILISEKVKDGIDALEDDSVRKNRGLNINTIFSTSYLLYPIINDNGFKKFEYLSQRQKIKESLF